MDPSFTAVVFLTAASQDTFESRRLGCGSVQGGLYPLFSPLIREFLSALIFPRGCQIIGCDEVCDQEQLPPQDRHGRKGTVTTD